MVGLLCEVRLYFPLFYFQVVTCMHYLVPLRGNVASVNTGTGIKHQKFLYDEHGTFSVWHCVYRGRRVAYHLDARFDRQFHLLLSQIIVKKIWFWTMKMYVCFRGCSVLTNTHILKPRPFSHLHYLIWGSNTVV